MSPSISLNTQNRYEIKVYGQLDDSWQDLFGQAKIDVEMLQECAPVTTISEVAMDQAGLVGLVRRLHGLGIVLLSIRQV